MEPRFRCKVLDDLFGNIIGYRMFVRLDINKGAIVHIFPNTDQIICDCSICTNIAPQKFGSQTDCPYKNAIYGKLKDHLRSKTH